jgi:bla regulator protein blaR1
MMQLPQSWIPWIDVLGWTLLHFLWQGVAIGLIYVALRPVFDGVVARYRFGMITLTALALCPLATAIWLWPTSGSAVSAIDISEMGGVAAPFAAAASKWHFEALLPWLVVVWLVGVTFIAGRAFLNWRRLNWLIHHASAPLPECRETLARLCARFGIRRPVRLLASLRVGTPMLIGWIKPVILLPASMLSGFTPHQIELIVAHELGHVRRWDYLANLFQVVIETILFYHPVVHWISRDVRNARESCCDDLVITLADGSPVVYARALADLEELRHEGGIAAPALGASGGVLLARIRRIVGVQHDFTDPLPRNNSWLVVIIAAAGVLLAAMRLQTHPVTPAALLPTPVQSLALLTGNPSLAAAPKEKTIVTPAIANVVSGASPIVRDAPKQPTPIDVARVARPHIDVLAPSLSMTRVKNVSVAPIANSLSTPSEVVVDSNASVVENPLPSAAIATPAVPATVYVVQPRYPLRELVAGATAKVALEFRIAADGSVTNIHPVNTASAAFQEAAIAALREWKFSTAASIDTTQRYTRIFAFTKAGADACHEVTGSHICRRVSE